MSLNSPHIFKKGKILKLKSLHSTSSTLPPRTYFFSLDKGNVPGAVNLLNNLNEICSRNWLKLSKLNHFFGIQKDFSARLSKNKEPFDQFFNQLNDLFASYLGGGKGIEDAQPMDEETESKRPVRPYDELEKLHTDINTLVDLVKNQDTHLSILKNLVLKQDDQIRLLKESIKNNTEEIQIVKGEIVTKTILAETFHTFDERLQQIQNDVSGVMELEAASAKIISDLSKKIEEINKKEIPSNKEILDTLTESLYSKNPSRFSQYLNVVTKPDYEDSDTESEEIHHNVRPLKEEDVMETDEVLPDKAETSQQGKDYASSKEAEQILEEENAKNCMRKLTLHNICFLDKFTCEYEKHFYNISDVSEGMTWILEIAYEDGYNPVEETFPDHDIVFLFTENYDNESTETETSSDSGDSSDKDLSHF
ncbi:hypothetical protein L6452_27798 [Arctium lappa]|uniref:Uncharacterized protein n=1 Tax=Arctium lappa TaxID=4217 RepID=A0ACB8ZY50_ARCLA|nr:hypothetical protein L6452_27798 [Arctium lappa]